MYVLVVGGGKLGANLAEMLRDAKHEVVIVEQDRKRAECVAEEMTDVRVVCGDGCEPAVLESAEVGRADAVAAVTGDDEDNLVVCLLGRREYGARLTIARVNDPRNEWLFDESFGVDIAVSNTRIIARLLTEEVGLGHIVTLLTVLKGGLELVELQIADDSPALGVPLAELGVPPTARLVAVVRDSEVLVPGPETVLHVGDHVLAVSKVGSAGMLKERLSGSE
ncbi:MAG: NAD-binding protein [Coriobacteriia bacterium]|nr:NAD-binding protein [Coriobacteriia bacterium]